MAKVKLERNLLMGYDELMGMLSQREYLLEKKKKVEGGQMEMSDFEKRLMYSSLYETERLIYDEIESWRFIRDMEKKEMEAKQIRLRKNPPKFKY